MDSFASSPISISQPPSPLVSSLQMPGLDGWTTLTLKDQKSSVQLMSGRGSGISGSDTNSEIWYFVSPQDRYEKILFVTVSQLQLLIGCNRFSGDLSSSYNGKLSFTLVHAQTPLQATQLQAPDVMIEASCGFSLMMFQATQQVPFYLTHRQ
eukprot:767419-Hanusia_phi.AAC.5